MSYAPLQSRPAADAPANKESETDRWREEAARFAPALGVAGVDIRSDETSRRLTEAEGARGVALGNTVHIHPERVRPGTVEGSEVLVHELVHIAQSHLPADCEAGRGAAEAEAAELARAIVGGGSGRPRRRIDLSRVAADGGADGATVSDPPIPVTTTRREIELGLSRANHAAEAAFDDLVADPSKRDEVIAGLLWIAPDLMTAAIFIEQLGGSAATDFTASIEQLSAITAKLSRWVEGRPAHASLEQKLLHVIRQVNRLRKQSGLGLIGAMPTPVMPMSVTDEEQKESANYDKALADFNTSLAARYEALVGGATMFGKRVELDTSSRCSNWSELALDVVIAVIGNLIGPVGKLVAAARESTQQFLQGTITDAVEAVAQTAAQTAIGDASKAGERRDQIVFVTSLTTAHSEGKKHAALAVNERVRRGTVSEAQLKEMTTDLETADLTALTRSAYLEACWGYTKLRAHQSLGTETDYPTGTTVSAMDGYVRGRDAVGTLLNNRVSDVGVAKLSVDVIDESGTLIVRHFGIHGMNTDVTQAILERAGGNVDRLGIPLEIAFTLNYSGDTARTDRYHIAFLVLDELGRIRDMLDWFDDMSTPDQMLANVRALGIPLTVKP